MTNLLERVRQSTAMQVELAGETHLLRPGRVFQMGRQGDLIIDDSPYLPDTMLTLTYEARYWWLANVGRRETVVLSDPLGATRCVITPGSRVPLLFSTAYLRFGAGPYSYELSLTVEAPAMELMTRAAVDDYQVPVSGTSFTASQLLAILAVAEPLLLQGGGGVWVAPSAIQAARRLGWTQTKFNRKLDNVCEKLDRAGVRGLKGEVGRQANGRRVRLAEYAVNAQIVTKSDLPRLDEEELQSRLAS